MGEKLTDEGKDAMVREAARTLYFAFDDATDLPTAVFQHAADGHFFSALRLLFDPAANLSSPASREALSHKGRG